MTMRGFPAILSRQLRSEAMPKKHRANQEPRSTTGDETPKAASETLIQSGSEAGNVKGSSEPGQTRSMIIVSAFRAGQLFNEIDYRLRSVNLRIRHKPEE